MLNKLATIVYFFCFKKQTLELLLHLSLNAEFPTHDLQDISFLVLKSIQTWKNYCEAISELRIKNLELPIKNWGSEFLSYGIELQNPVTENGVTLWVTNLKIFIEMFLSSY